MNSRHAYGVLIGVRAGMDEAPDARPWETPPAVPVTTVQPRTRHVLVEIAGAWIEALALELRHAGDSWDVHTAYVLPGAGLVDEWAPISRIRPLHSR